MDKSDYDNFIVFMRRVWDLCVGYKDELDKNKIDGYFLFLSDLSYEDVVKNTMLRMRRDNKGFPEISEMRGEDQTSIDIAANEAFDVILNTCYSVYSPDAEQRNKGIKRSLDFKGHPELYDVCLKWYYRIRTDDNSSALRAQFIKSFKGKINIEADKRLMAGMQREALPETVKKHIPGLKLIGEHNFENGRK